MHSNRHRGNDWHFIVGRKEKEGRAPLTGDETVSHRKKSMKTQLVQDDFRAGPRIRVALRLTLVRAGSKLKVIKTGGGAGLHRQQYYFPKGLLQFIMPAMMREPNLLCLN